MSFAPPSTTPESANQSTSDTNIDTDMATMTATATRQQLRVGPKSSTAAFPTSQIPRNGSTKPNSNTWEMGNNPNTSGGDKNTWTGSWSKIQNIASTALGSVGLVEEEEEERKRRIRIAERRRRAGLDTFKGGKSSGSNSTPASSASTLRSRVGGSAVGEGEEDFRTRGRRKMEEDETKSRRPPNVSAVTGTSISSRPLHKRTTSPDLLPLQNRASSSLSSTSRSEDTLAYIHKVRPTDTLEGVVIMYNIHPSALRRANRLWMGDSIQWRGELYLPVDECLVKGRPLTKEEEVEAEVEKQSQDKENRKEGKEPILLDIYESEASASISITGTRARRKDAFPSIPDSIPETIDKPTSNILEGEDSPPRHHSYVIISGIGRVEIGRLSRNTLSHFPPRRGRARELSTSSTTNSEDIRILDPLSTSSSSSVFKTGGKMFGQVARETRDGVENVGSLVEGFVRRVVIKVGEMARDGTEAAIELAEHVGSKGAEGNERGEVRREYRRVGVEEDGTGSSTYGAASAREMSGGGSGGVRGLRGRGSLLPGSDSAAEWRAG
ncbi:hypothetical protein BGX38DRAFT_1272560 [Terfezia claveryi]|nr:hypothetical protein BGX38DRAFT_1272560 [Terfezia claveryi]